MVLYRPLADAEVGRDVLAGMAGQDQRLIDDKTWATRYLVVDTGNWWFGQHVLISPHAVRDVSWSGHEVSTGLSRNQVKASPPWNPADIIDRDYERLLHGYYGWPGYGL